MPNTAPAPAFVVCSAMFAVAALFAAPLAHACGNGQQRAFTCKTTNNKVVEVCNAGKDATYSFGRAGVKPELFLKVPKTKLRYVGQGSSTAGRSGAGLDYSLRFPNGKTSYTIAYAGPDSAKRGSGEAAVEVEVNGRHVASVACRSETIATDFHALGLRGGTGQEAMPTVSRQDQPRAVPRLDSRRIVFAKRAKPRVTDFVWNAHHPDGVKFDGPVRTSIGTLRGTSDGFALDGAPIIGPHGRKATVLGGTILDYAGRLAIIYSYWADGACMACGSEGVILVGPKGQLIDQIDWSAIESPENECIYPSAEKFEGGVAVNRASADCASGNKVLRIGYEGIEISPR